MRTFSLSVLGLFFGLALVAPIEAQTTFKIGYVDSQQLLSQAPGAQQARQALERDLVRFEAELKELEDELTKMIQDFQQQQIMLSPDARRQREQAIRQKQQAYEQRAVELENTYGRRQAELLDPVMQRISEVIEELRKEGGYALVLDSAALLAADPALDLTAAVLTRLRAAAANRS